MPKSPSKTFEDIPIDIIGTKVVSRLASRDAKVFSTSISKRLSSSLQIENRKLDIKRKNVCEMRGSESDKNVLNITYADCIDIFVKQMKGMIPKIKKRFRDNYTISFENDGIWKVDVSVDIDGYLDREYKIDTRRLIINRIGVYIVHPETKKTIHCLSLAVSYNDITREMYDVTNDLVAIGSSGSSSRMSMSNSTGSSSGMSSSNVDNTLAVLANHWLPLALASVVALKEVALSHKTMKNYPLDPDVLANVMRFLNITKKNRIGGSRSIRRTVSKNTKT